MSTAAKPRPVPPPADGARPNPYARFIPREELESFQAWSLGDIGDAPAANGSSGRDDAGAGSASPIDPAELIAQQLHAARQSGYQDGYRDGLVALDGFKQSFAAQTTAQVGTLVASIGEQLDGLQQDMAQSLAAAACALAARIVRSELAQRPEAVVVVAEQAVEALLQSARHVGLRVHPDDHALVAEGAAEAIAARGVRLIADAAVSRGGCLVESDIAGIDASVEERWRKAIAAIGRSDAWPGDDMAEGNVEDDAEVRVEGAADSPARPSAIRS